MTHIVINMSFSTDGDVEFKNDDNYFSYSWEHYGKTIETDEKNFLPVFQEFISNIQSRVFNRYDQHAWLVQFCQELTLEKIIDSEFIDVESCLDYYTLLSGNQHFQISINKQEKSLRETNLETNFDNFKKLFLETKDHPEMKDFLWKNYFSIEMHDQDVKNRS